MDISVCQRILTPHTLCVKITGREVPMKTSVIKELRDKGLSWTQIGEIEAKHTKGRSTGGVRRSQYRREYQRPNRRKKDEESRSGAPKGRQKSPSPNAPGAEPPTTEVTRKYPQVTTEVVRENGTSFQPTVHVRESVHVTSRKQTILAGRSSSSSMDDPSSGQSRAPCFHCR